MKKCKWCQTDIEDKAKICPNCKKDLRNWFAKHPVITVVLVLVVILPIMANKGKEAKQEAITASANGVKQEVVTKAPEPELTVTAVQLAKDYDENEIKANSLYKGKLIKITGEIDTIGEVLSSTYVTLSAGKDFALTRSQCFFDNVDEIAKIVNMKKGDKVTIIGRVDGKSMNVGIRECKFIN